MLQYNEEDEEEDKTEASKLLFDLEVLEHSPREISILLDFQYPGLVSSSRDGNDKLKVKVLRPKIFTSAATLKRIQPESFDDPNTFMYSNLPPIIADPDQAKSIVGTTDTGGLILNYLSTSNFVLGLIMGGSMEQLWGMIRAL